MAQTVIGIFDSADQAQQAVEQLVSNGFMRNNIDISTQLSSETMDNSTDRYDNDDTHGNFFKSLFDDSEEATNYSQVARRGSVITVHTQSQQEAERASSILDQYGAVDVNERVAQYNNRASAGAMDTTTTQAASMDSNASLPVIEEQLQVGKRVVETGGTRLRSRIIQRPVEESLRLREEHLHIERNQVNRPATEADFTAFKEGTIEITEQKEVAVVAKEMRVVEEVTLSKEVEERQETIRDTVRNTEVEVEEIKSDKDQGFITGTTERDDSSFLEESHKSWQNVLRRMSEVEDDYKVADDDPDVRGWDVVDSTGEKLGEVDELIVDTQAMKVRYLDIEVEDDFAGSDDRHILIPIGAATLDNDNDLVIVATLTSGMLANFPVYNGESISREYEHKVMSAISPNYQAGAVSNDTFYEGEHFNTNQFSGSKRSDNF